MIIAYSGKCPKCGLTYTGMSDFETNMKRYHIPFPARAAINLFLREVGSQGVDSTIKCANPNCNEVFTIRAFETNKK
jgi:hypothetical protein